MLDCSRNVKSVLATDWIRKGVRECALRAYAGSLAEPSEGDSYRLGLFKQRIVRNGGVVLRPRAVPLLVPAPAAERPETPVRPSLTKDVAASGDSRKNKKTGFDAMSLRRRRSHGPGTRAEWSLSRAPRRLAATATEERIALPQSSCH